MTIPIFFDVELSCSFCVHGGTQKLYADYDKEADQFTPKNISIGCSLCRRTIVAKLEIFEPSYFNENGLRVFIAGPYYAG